MSRIIKFRAWWKDTGKPVINFMVEYSLDALSSDCFIIEQSTGLLDKNGKEGYDGELIRASVGKITGGVKWNDFHGAWWVYIDDHEFCPLAGSLRAGGYFIGNIHEQEEK
jgi:hypothetical protein